MLDYFAADARVEIDSVKELLIDDGEVVDRTGAQRR